LLNVDDREVKDNRTNKSLLGRATAPFTSLSCF
jgi:hypothetical protein